MLVGLPTHCVVYVGMEKIDFSSALSVSDVDFRSLAPSSAQPLCDNSASGGLPAPVFCLQLCKTF